MPGPARPTVDRRAPPRHESQPPSDDAGSHRERRPQGDRFRAARRLPDLCVLRPPARPFPAPGSRGRQARGR
jgi:hypothetical protein